MKSSHTPFPLDQPCLVAPDLKLKEQAMARTAPSHMPPARYRPEDDVLVFLNSL